MNMQVKSFFHPPSSTLTYVVHGDRSSSKACAIIDPVLDYNPGSAGTSHASADAVLAYVTERELNVGWILETHAHADHLSAAPYIQAKVGGTIGIGEGICVVQETFKRFYELEDEFACDGCQFDHLFKDGETFHIGELEAQVMSTPGHTPACITYVIEDAAFVGDTLFMPDGGTARADFPGGDAATLYHSLSRILDLPDGHRIFVCHDYQPGGRELLCETTVAEQRARNIHLGGGTNEADYVEMRTTRDANLAVPALLLPAIQVNIRGGRLPPASESGTAFLKVPLNKIF